jgi:hypothetical protein
MLDSWKITQYGEHTQEQQCYYNSKQWFLHPKYNTGIPPCIPFVVQSFPWLQ